jgi:translocator protein
MAYKFDFTSLYKRFGFLDFTLLTILVNTLAIVLPLNGKSTKAISDMYFTYLTPSGSTFAIWSVIYTCLLVISALIAFKKVSISNKTLNLYGIGSVLNCLWIFLWHFNIIALSPFVLFGLFLANVLVLKSWDSYKLAMNPTQAIFKKLSLNLYLIYAAWTLVATIINITIFLQYQLNLSSIFGIAGYQWAYFVAVAAVPICYYLLVYPFRSPIAFLVLAWAYYGISTNWKLDNSLVQIGVSGLFSYLTLFPILGIAGFYLVEAFTAKSQKVKN